MSLGYYLQTDPGVLALLVRHGPTELNAGSEPRVRGWTDTMLTPEGREMVRQTAKDLKQYEPKGIISSDFMRDSQTAQIIASELGIADLSVDFNARTWDTGSFSGKPESEVNPAILALYRRPWESVPGGQESFNAFSERWQQFLDRRMSVATIEGMRPQIIVTHGRNIALTDSYYNARPLEEGDMPLPSGYAVVSVDLERRINFDIPGEKECVCLDR